MNAVDPGGAIAAPWAWSGIVWLLAATPLVAQGLPSDVILSGNGIEQRFVQRCPNCGWQFTQLCKPL